MPLTEKQKRYARDWYAKNKARLNADPKRKKSRAISNKKYSDRNKEKYLLYHKEYHEIHRKSANERSRQYYKDNRARFIKLQTEKRNTPEYKEYMRRYKIVNKQRLLENNRRPRARYMRRQSSNLTDVYIVSMILLSPHNTLSRLELKQRPDLIEQKREQIRAYREKYPKNIDADLVVQIEETQKKREQVPYEFIKQWRD